MWRTIFQRVMHSAARYINIWYRIIRSAERISVCYCLIRVFWRWMRKITVLWKTEQFRLMILSWRRFILLRSHRQCLHWSLVPVQPWSPIRTTAMFWHVLHIRAMITIVWQTIWMMIISINWTATNLLRSIIKQRRKWQHLVLRLKLWRQLQVWWKVL